MNVSAIKATWKNGQILPNEPVDWPEGSELLVEPFESSHKIGMDESEWRDDPYRSRNGSRLSRKSNR